MSLRSPRLLLAEAISTFSFILILYAGLHVGWIIQFHMAGAILDEWKGCVVVR
jgi:hypothetical protein